MHPKVELYRELRKICDIILEEIVCPVCHIGPGILADLWLADLDCYCMDDENDRQEIYKRIIERWNLDPEQFEAYVDSYTPLIQVALYIYLNDRKEPADGSTAQRQ